MLLKKFENILYKKDLKVYRSDICNVIYFILVRFHTIHFYTLKTNLEIDDKTGGAI